MGFCHGPGVLERSGPTWGVLDFSGLFWIVLDCSGAPCGRTFWEVLGRPGPGASWGGLGLPEPDPPEGSVRGVPRLCRCALGRSGAFWCVLERGLLGRLGASWSVLGRPEASWDRSEAFWHRSEAAFYGVLGGGTQNAQSMCYFCTISSVSEEPRRTRHGWAP